MRKMIPVQYGFLGNIVNVNVNANAKRTSAVTINH
ncbi:hypothetical protein SAMN05878482_1057 [Peribacillus simplex]|uniref:Uncharacterized protein n=1 Tax=Peribacillus simplex TaxID=1478 RepID=A0A9X8RAV1_9BACI|nr:hypothetical protein SAMN05878482_1057 [Peribacillus simplex]